MSYVEDCVGSLCAIENMRFKIEADVRGLPYT